MPLTYHPELFDARTVEQARAIILTGEGSTPDERWRTETPWICGLIAENITLTSDSVVLDYGCGIGRVAKELIARVDHGQCDPLEGLQQLFGRGASRLSVGLPA